MRITRESIWAVLSSIAVASGVSRAQIQVTATPPGGLPQPVGTFGYGADIVLSTAALEQLLGQPAEFIRVYDVRRTPVAEGDLPLGSPPPIQPEVGSNGVGRVVIRVDSTALAPDFRVMVASPFPPPPLMLPIDFGNEDPSTPIVQGAIDFRGITVVAANPTDPSLVAAANQLRNRLSVAASVTRAIGQPGQADRIEVGKVFRLQSTNVLLSELGNCNLHATVVAVAPDGQLDFTGDGFNSIETIEVDGSILASITAGGDPRQLPLGSDNRPAPAAFPSSISSVTVGPDLLTSQGIQGDVLATGTIRSILTSGPIGTAAAPVSIVASDGLFEVRTIAVIDPATQQAVLRPVDFEAEFIANAAYAVDAGNEELPRWRPARDAAIYLIETPGNLRGPILAGNVGGFGAEDSLAFGPRQGIYVGGAIQGPIVIDLNLERANILAQTFEEPIWVGVKLQGAIVAFDESAPEVDTDGDGIVDPSEDTNGNGVFDLGDGTPLGRIPALTVGMGETAGTSAYTFSYPGRDDQDWGFPRGMSGGTESPPYPSGTGPRSFSRSDWDGEATDTVVRAPFIGPVLVNEMTTRINGGDPGKAVPRLEALKIQSLTIGTMDAGVVWSGNFHPRANPEMNGRADLVRVDDYAEVLSAPVIVGRMTRLADLWLVGQTPVRIEEAMAGDLFIDRLVTDVYIGTTLGIDGPAPVGETGTTRELSARDVNNRDLPEADPGDLQLDNSPAGRIMIRDPQGLVGQISVNGQGLQDVNEGDSWNGTVHIGTAVRPEEDRVILAARAIENQATGPLLFFGYKYRILPRGEPPRALGGGALGVVPFQVHRLASTPSPADDNDLPVPPGGFLDLGGFLTPASNRRVVIEHYGRIGAVGIGPIVRVERRSFEGTGEYTDVTASFAATIVGRNLILTPSPSATPEMTAALLGSFVVTPTDSLRSLVPTARGSLVAVGPPLNWAFWFRLGCGSNILPGNPNPADIVSIGGFPPPDGDLTVDDYTSFLNAFAGEDMLANIVGIGGFPPPDDELTVDDYTAFINAFAEGCS